MSIADWYIALFLLGSGIGIGAFWIGALAMRKVDTLGDFGSSRNWHIAAELLTAVLLIVGGIFRLADQHGQLANTFAPLGLGAVMYAAVQSSGYYKQKTPVLVPVLGLTGIAAIPALVILALGR